MCSGNPSARGVVLFKVESRKAQRGFSLNFMYFFPIPRHLFMYALLYGSHAQNKFGKTSFLQTWTGALHLLKRFTISIWPSNEPFSFTKLRKISFPSFSSYLVPWSRASISVRSWIEIARQPDKLALITLRPAKILCLCLLLESSFYGLNVNLPLVTSWIFNKISAKLLVHSFYYSTYYSFLHRSRQRAAVLHIQ